jgi:amino acid adenylation domain-containing protein
VEPNVASTNDMQRVTDNWGRATVAGIAALLARYTDRHQLVIGFRAGEDPGTLPLALDLSGDPTFSELLERVAGAIETATADAAPMGGVELDALVEPGNGHPRVLVRENGSLHEPGDSDPLAGHLQTLLEAAQAGPDRNVAALPMLTEPERERLLHEWNQTAADFPQSCLHELFARQAARTPGAVAVQYGDELLTYAELDAQANQLAHHLQGLGVGPEVLVGICVERSARMVVGLLGILKAGGGYVPIDPAYPADRQAFMLESSEAPVILTEDRLRASLPDSDARIVGIDGEWDAISRHPIEAPASSGAHNPDQLAYVIYTSGSTGQPKGVQIQHRSLVNFLLTMQDTPGLGADDVLVAVTTLSFDIAGLELYLPLITGARVVIAPAATASEPRALAELLSRSSSTIMQATPTTWRMLVDSGWTPPAGMKALCGGEALPVALADSLVELGLELWNMYGPTETTIWSTCAHVETRGKSLTIGRPIANTTLYILDSAMEPVPVGVAGELWIGGHGLARGYRGRDDLTTERFVPDPFDRSPGARIYRTGDLARYRPDGAVDFLGRLDNQVKVRGFRIELGEIETVLANHPAVSSAVVVARGSGAEAELAAYVIPLGVPVGTGALRQYLTQSLPAYMVPSTVTLLDAFPLTPNGKVDRKALPEPTRERSGDHELVAPRTGMERRLVQIWERELGIKPIGVTDDFFDLGVTSILAGTLFAAIEHELGDTLPLGAIFRAPTIEALAELLENADATSRWSSLIPIQPLGSKPPIFCIHGGAGTILHLAALARRLGNDQPFYGLQSRGLYGGALPLKTVEEMATHYLAEMREVWPSGPWYLGGYCFGTIVAFEIAERLTAAGEEVRLVTMFNGPSPSWIKRFGWYGNQPSYRERHGRPPRPTSAQRPQSKLKKLLTRLKRGILEPRRIISGLMWELNKPLTRVSLALGRPVPERHREEYFLWLHALAEQAYQPKQYPGDLLIFSGEGLYDDPTLGWDGLAAGGIQAHRVPGLHDNNRQALMEPAVGFVAERIESYLENGGAPAAHDTPAGDGTG